MKRTAPDVALVLADEALHSHAPVCRAPLVLQIKHFVIVPVT